MSETRPAIAASRSLALALALAFPGALLAGSSSGANPRGSADFDATTVIPLEPTFFATPVAWSASDGGPVFFRAVRMTGGQSGLYISGGPGGFSKIVESGDDAPDLPGDEVIGGISAWVATGSGFAYSAFLIGTGVDSSNDIALFAGTTGGGTRLVFREGDAVPGLSGETYDFGVEQLRVDSSGHVLFEVQLDPSGKAVVYDDGAATVVVEANIELLALESGWAALIGFLDGAFGIWGGAPGSVAELARVGDSAAGSPASYAEFDSISIAAAGRLAFKADLSNGKDAVISGLGGSAHLVRESSATLGTPTVNANGDVAFVESVGLPSVAVTAETPALTTIAAGGSQAPGTPAGTEFADFLGQPIINDFRQVAFFAILSGTGVGSANDRSLWIHQPGFGPQLVAREGGTIRIGPADTRTIQFIETFPTSSLRDGVRTTFTHTGRLFYKATFTDGNSALLFAQVLPSEVVFYDGFESGDLTAWAP